MDTNKLLAAAARANITYVAGTGFDVFNLVRRKFTSADLISSKWLNERHIWGSDAAPDFKKESTYSDCIRWQLDIGEATPTLEIRMWDGDAMDGFPTDPRCMWVFKCPADHVVFKYFEERILRDIRRQSEAEQVRREEARRRAEAEEIFQSYF